VPEENAQHLEVRFMSPLDNAANRAMERILAIDESQIDNVQKYLGSAPSKPLLSPEQREKVMS